MQKQKPTSGTNKQIISNVAKLDNTHPIPFEERGLAFMAEKNYRYIPFLGHSDNFFEVLSETKLLSPTNNACVNTKTRYAVGKGWTFKDETLDKAFNDIFAKKVNKKGHNLNDILKAIFSNYYTSGNGFANMVLAETGSAKSLRCYVKNNFDSRLAYTCDMDVATDVIFSSRFRQETGYIVLSSDQTVIPLYNGDDSQKWAMDAQKNQHICIHIKNEVPECDYYGLPSNVASLLQQQLEYKGARFNIDNFENNLVLGGIVLIKSNMSEAEAAKHGKKIIQAHTGDGKRGRWMIMAGENGIDDVVIKPFEQTKDGSFLEQGKRSEEQIIVANDWDAVLAGINTGTSLGRGKGYFKEIFEVKYNSVIRPDQEYIIRTFLQPVVNMVNKIYGTKFPAELIDIVTPMPVSYGSDIDPNKVMTVKEGRTYFPGLSEDGITEEQGAQIIDQNKGGKDVSAK